MTQPVSGSRHRAIRTGRVMAAAALVGLAQIALSGRLALGGVPAGLVPGAALTFGFLFGPLAGTIVGALGGLLTDLAVGQWIGLLTLQAGLIGWLAGQVEEQVFKENFVVPFFGSLAASALEIGVTWFLLSVFGRPIAWPAALAVGWRLAAVNLVAALVIYALTYRWRRWFVYVSPDWRV